MTLIVSFKPMPLIPVNVTETVAFSPYLTGWLTVTVKVASAFSTTYLPSVISAS